MARKVWAYVWNWVLTPHRLDSLDLAMPKNAPFPRFKLPVPTVKVKRTNRAAQKNRISEPKAAVKILNLGPCISKIVANDISRMEAQNTIKRKREKKAVRVKRKLEEAAKLIAREAWKAKVKQITPILIAPKKTREGKASSFPKIRDSLGRKTRNQQISNFFLERGQYCRKME